MSGVNRRFLLRERPVGRIDDRTFELVEEPVPVIGEGEALVRTRSETVVEGFDQLPVAINMLFDGQNTGKLVVKL